MENLEILRKRIFYQSQHRGMREMDLVLGGFAQKHIKLMNREDLLQFETLLSFADQELYSVLFEKRPLQHSHSLSLLQTLQRYVDDL